MLLTGGKAHAQAPDVPQAPAVNLQPPRAPGASPDTEPVDMSLSPECRVPGSRLYALAPLRGVKAALKARRTVKVLAIGSSSTVGLGASSPIASYPARLEDELEKLFPGIDVDVVNRGISGEIASGAAQRMKDTVAEVEPDLVVWQVGTNDALARVDMETFTESLNDTIAWLKLHKIDVVLVDPQYTASLAKDDYFGRVVKTIEESARKNRVPLVHRFGAMQYLAGKAPGKSFLSRDQLHLNDLGYRCMAEHVARAVTVGLLQGESPGAAPDAPAAPPAVAQ